MKEVRQIKQLQSQLNILQGDAEALKIDISNKQKEHSQKMQSIARLKEEILKLGGNDTLKISEHALVRYFERVKGYNIAEIEKEILSEDIIKLINTLGGNGQYPNKGFSIVMKNNTVITIV